MKSFCLLLSTAAVLAAQAVPTPVIDPRGVTDAFRLDPAPATVGRGALLRITGFNLGPTQEVVAKAVPLTTSLGDPAVQVLVNGAPAGLYSVSAAKIVAQVPLNAGLGSASVEVVVGGVKSDPVLFTVAASQPGILTANGLGFGLAAGDLSKSPVTLTGAGFGTTNPRTGTVAAFVGGNAAKVSTTASKTLPGAFDTVIEIPGAARPGDPLYLSVAGKLANPVTLTRSGSPAARLLALPTGAPDLVQISTTDVNGSYVLGTSARDSAGCSAAFSFDFATGKAASLNPCLLTATAAANPFITSAGTEFAAALLGPATGKAPAGIAKQVLIASPGTAAKTVDLTGSALSLTGVAGGDFTAAIPAVDSGKAKIDTIVASTGVVTEADVTAATAAAPVTLNIDGLKFALTARVALPGGLIGVVLADDLTAPTKVEFAIAKASTGEKVSAAQFPGGYVPLLAPLATGQTVTVGTGLAFYLASLKSVYVASKMPDDSAHAFAVFPIDGSDPATVAMPSNWYIAACTNTLKTFNITLAGQLALFGSNSSVDTYKAACAASGFVEVDRGTGAVSIVKLPAAAQLVVSGANGTFNDYVYGSDFVAKTGTSTTLYVLDGASGTATQMAPPPSVNAFGTSTVLTQLNALVAPATKKAAGDQGLVLFDLDAGSSTLLPIPDGFATVSLVGFYPATRKILARGISTDSKTSSLIVYDLVQSTSAVVDNPTGVASIGSKPGVAAIGARLIAVNTNAGAFAAVAFDAAGKQVGVVTLRVP